MLVYSIYCTVVSLLLFSPSIEPCICKYVPPPRLGHKLFAGGKVMEVVTYFISKNLLFFFVVGIIVSRIMFHVLVLHQKYNNAHVLFVCVTLHIVRLNKL